MVGCGTLSMKAAGAGGGQSVLTGSVECVACVPGVSGKDTTARKCIREKNSRCLRGLVERVKVVVDFLLAI